MAVTVGDLAPDFTLPGRGGVPVTLSSLRGRNVVLVFFPGAFTEVCTEHLGAIAGHEERYAREDAQVVAVSADKHDSQSAFADQLGLREAIMLSDFHPKGEVSRLYGVWLEDWGYPTRATFVIDREGVVRHVAVVIPPEIPDEDAVLAALAACPGGAAAGG